MNEIIVIVFGVIGGLIVILFLLNILLRKNVQETKYDPAKYNSIVSEQDVKTRIDELLSKNDKIRAIKFLRENKNLSLIEAKQMIEKYAENNSPAALNILNNVYQTSNDDGELVNHIKMLLRQEKKIDAIKLVVESKKIGLKEAKDFVDKLG